MEQLCLDAYDKTIGLDLANLVVDGGGIPLGVVVAGVNRHDSPLLPSTLETLRRFDDLPDRITVHLDAGYNSHQTRELLAELGCDCEIATKGIPAPIQANTRWVGERTKSWHNRGFEKVAICTEVRTRVIDAFIALANAIIIVRRLIREAWTRYRWNGRPERFP